MRDSRVFLIVAVFLTGSVSAIFIPWEKFESNFGTWPAEDLVKTKMYYRNVREAETSAPPPVDEEEGGLISLWFEPDSVEEDAGQDEGKYIRYHVDTGLYSGSWYKWEPATKPETEEDSGLFSGSWYKWQPAQPEPDEDSGLLSGAWNKWQQPEKVEEPGYLSSWFGPKSADNIQDEDSKWLSYIYSSPEKEVKDEEAWYSSIFRTASDDTSSEEFAEVETFCTAKKTFLCPNLKQHFQAPVCCDSNWIAKGANLNTGDECFIDLAEMEKQCDIRTCYKAKAEENSESVWSTDGCTMSPDYFLSYESCVMHDLCYVTPGTTKEGCDNAMEDNINKIYCENVNYKDSYSCYVRSKVGDFANKVMSLTDRWYKASESERKNCTLEESVLTGTWKYLLRANPF